MLSSLSGPQKVLVVFAITLVIAFLGITVAALALSQNFQLPSLHTSQESSIQIKTIAASNATTASYNQEILVTEDSLVSWPNVQLIALKDSRILATANSLEIKSGAVLLKASDTPIRIGNWQVTNSITGVTQIENKLYLFQGRAQKGESILTAGNAVDLETDQITSITRREVINQPDLVALRGHAAIFSTNLPWLTDTTPPRMLTLSPQPGSVVNESTIRLTGTTDDLTAQIKVNGTETPNNAGRFSLDIKLIEGENNMIITLNDAYGNVISSQLLVTYIPQSV